MKIIFAKFVFILTVIFLTSAANCDSRNHQNDDSASSDEESHRGVRRDIVFPNEVQDLDMRLENIYARVQQAFHVNESLKHDMGIAFEFLERGVQSLTYDQAYYMASIYQFCFAYQGDLNNLQIDLNCIYQQVQPLIFEGNLEFQNNVTELSQRLGVVRHDYFLKMNSLKTFVNQYLEMITAEALSSNQVLDLC
jgi:hypothetical protein